jgi:hypothetical protein
MSWRQERLAVQETRCVVRGPRVCSSRKRCHVHRSGQFKVLRLTSDASFAAEFTAERDLIGSERTKA